MNCSVSPLSREDIRKLANKIRRLFGTNSRFDIIKFIDLILPQIDPAFEYLEIVDDDELPDCYAKAFPSQHRIVVRNSVYEGAANGNVRDRFTLSHELGHYILHGLGNVSYARNTSEPIQAFRNPEWQANTFAGELLVPANVAINSSIPEISQLCGVSIAVARIQKEQILNKKNKANKRH